MLSWKSSQKLLTTIQGNYGVLSPCPVTRPEGQRKVSNKH